MEVHRHDYVELFWLQGYGSVLIDFENYPLSGKSLIAIGPGRVHAWHVKKLTGLYIAFTQEFFDGTRPPPSALFDYPYMAKDFLEISDGDWDQMMNLNFMSGVRLSRAYLRGMKERNWGRIIFISSESGVKIPHVCYAVEFEKCWEAHECPVGDSWRCDETYLKVRSVGFIPEYRNL
jgi:short chain dehydrogenase